MSAARVQSTVSLGCADRLSQIRFDDAPLSHAVGSRQKGKHLW